MSEKIIELRNVSKTFKLGLFGSTVVQALSDVSFDVKKGEIVGLLGESGSGKSTIARIILKVYKPSSGQLLFRDKDITNIYSASFLKNYYKHVQGVFQDPYGSFNPRRTVLEPLFDVVNNYELTHDKVEAEGMIRQHLEMVGINYNEVVQKHPHELSGGQLQRISIARALLVKPDLIVADEPVSMVDASTRVDILNIFLDLKQKLGISILLIGHDLATMHYASDRILVLYKGQVVEEGPASVLLDPLHPYTKMLSESTPSIDKPWEEKIKYRPGKVELAGKITGCPFADRCPYRMDKCITQAPPVITKDGRKVKCWLYA